MDTEVINVERQADTGKALCRAVEVLASGGLVAFPTETVYGVGVRVDDARALARLRELKSRSANKAFTVHIGSPNEAERFTAGLRGLATRIIRKGWPGPLTVVFPVDDPDSTPVMANLNGSAAAGMYYAEPSESMSGSKSGEPLTIGLRCPDHPFARALVTELEAPVVAASANLAGCPAPTTADEVLKGLSGKVDLLIDGGCTKYARASTIVRITGPSYEIVREGVYDAGILKRISALRVVLVCTGNTCRSPMAAGLTEKMLAMRLGCRPEELPSRGVVVSSAGTFGGGGAASPHAVTVMKRRGIDLSSHTSVALTPETIEQADHVFCMTRSHRDAVVTMMPSAENRAVLLTGAADIQDPVGGSEDDYEQCARLVEEGLSIRLREVIV